VFPGPMLGRGRGFGAAVCVAACIAGCGDDGPAGAGGGGAGATTTSSGEPASSTSGSSTSGSTSSTSSSGAGGDGAGGEGNGGATVGSTGGTGGHGTGGSAPACPDPATFVPEDGTVGVSSAVTPRIEGIGADDPWSVDVDDGVSHEVFWVQEDDVLGIVLHPGPDVGSTVELSRSCADGATDIARYVTHAETSGDDPEGLELRLPFGDGTSIPAGFASVWDVGAGPLYLAYDSTIEPGSRAFVRITLGGTSDPLDPCVPSILAEATLQGDALSIAIDAEHHPLGTLLSSRSSLRLRVGPGEAGLHASLYVEDDLRNMADVYRDAGFCAPDEDDLTCAMEICALEAQLGLPCVACDDLELACQRSITWTDLVEQAPGGYGVPTATTQDAACALPECANSPACAPG